MRDENRFDVAHRLRAVLHNPTMNRTHTVSDSLINEAADEIERLRAALRWVDDEARRYAGFYAPHSDGRNTFVMFADAVAARTVLDAPSADS